MVYYSSSPGLVSCRYFYQVGKLFILHHYYMYIVRLRSSSSYQRSQLLLQENCRIWVLHPAWKYNRSCASKMYQKLYLRERSTTRVTILLQDGKSSSKMQAISRNPQYLSWIQFYRTNYYKYFGDKSRYNSSAYIFCWLQCRTRRNILAPVIYTE